MKNKSSILAWSRHSAIIDQNLTTLRLDQAVDNSKERCLPTAACPDDRDKFTGVYGQVDIAQNLCSSFALLIRLANFARFELIYLQRCYLRLFGFTEMLLITEDRVPRAAKLQPNKKSRKIPLLHLPRRRLCYNSWKEGCHPERM